MWNIVGLDQSDDADGQSGNRNTTDNINSSAGIAAAELAASTILAQNEQALLFGGWRSNFGIPQSVGSFCCT